MQYGPLCAILILVHPHATTTQIARIIHALGAALVHHIDARTDPIDPLALAELLRCPELTVSMDRHQSLLGHQRLTAVRIDLVFIVRHQIVFAVIVSQRAIPARWILVRILVLRLCEDCLRLFCDI